MHYQTEPVNLAVSIRIAGGEHYTLWRTSSAVAAHYTVDLRSSLALQGLAGREQYTSACGTVLETKSHFAFAFRAPMKGCHYRTVTVDRVLSWRG